MRENLYALWSKHKTMLTAGGVMLIVCLLMLVTGIGCPIKYLTGISCPGCGMTRACISALHLDFETAFSYHPLWPALPIVVCLLILFKLADKNKAFNFLLFASIAIMIAVYIFRLFFTESEIVVFSPESGMIFQWIQNLTELFNSK